MISMSIQIKPKISLHPQDIGSEDLENDIVTTTTTVTKTIIPTSSSPIPYSNSDVVRETKTIRKTEVLHVDTANEPIT